MAEMLIIAEWKINQYGDSAPDNRPNSTTRDAVPKLTNGRMTPITFVNAIQLRLRLALSLLAGITRCVCVLSSPNIQADG